MNKKKFSSVIGHLLISIVAIFILFYMMLPAINLKSQDFFVFLILSILILLMINFLSYVKDFLTGFGNRGVRMMRDPLTGQVIFGSEEDPAEEPREKRSLAKPLKYGFSAIGLIIVFMFLASFIGNPFFHATKYRDLIQMTDGDFTEDIAELSMNQIPVVDKDTASRLGSRKLGEMSELVSQFEIENNYTQINYKGTPYRVTPLSYADPIKWFYNMREGLPAYITVNMVTQETELVMLPEGMKYSPSEYFFRNIHRHLRFHYPTKMFDSVSFEIDDEGTPYWVAPTITYRIGWWSGKDIDGAVLVNAITGESEFYAKDDVPGWIDQLYDSNLIISQLDDNGRFQNGFINSIFGQKGVRRTTFGYNYLAIDDDVFLYTGMSSVTADQSNIGFVLVNLRTKETRFYSVPGATETSAMESAQGQVQHLKYSATFPLLLNISDRPTYFISLKDNAGLVKMYAFVDVEQYQIVGTGQTIDEARKAYRNALNLEDVEIKDPVDTFEKEGIIDAIADVVVDGNTCYYFTLEGEDLVYAAEISAEEHLPFLKSGDQISFTFSEEGTPLLVEEISDFTIEKYEPVPEQAVAEETTATAEPETKASIKE